MHTQVKTTTHRQLALPVVIVEDIESVLARTPMLEELAGKTVLLTGAGGLLASYLTYTIALANERMLSRPCHLIATTRDPADRYPRLVPLLQRTDVAFAQWDCAKQSMPIDEPVHYVLHAASLASPIQYLAEPLDTVRANSTALVELLEFSRSQPVESLLFFSSGQIYGSPPVEWVPTPESYAGLVDPLGPRACHDESKRFGEMLCKVYARQYAVPARIVRPFQVYGPGLSGADKRAFAEFTQQAAAGGPVVLRSDGRARRTYCYLADATVAFWHVLLRGETGEAYNVGASEPVVSMAELAELIASLADPPTRVLQRIDPAMTYLADAPAVTCPDVRKVTALMRQGATTSLQEGFTRTLRWLREGAPLAEPVG